MQSCSYQDHGTSSILVVGTKLIKLKNMTSRDFCFWLQGFFEISVPLDINSDQVDLIKRHLNLVFIHEIDPSMGDEQEQDKLNNIHQGKNSNGTVMRC